MIRWSPTDRKTADYALRHTLAQYNDKEFKSGAFCLGHGSSLVRGIVVLMRPNRCLRDYFLVLTTHAINVQYLRDYFLVLTTHAINVQYEISLCKPPVF
jgi:hypothetical protein